MDLMRPDQLQADTVSSELLRAIDDAAHKVNELRPLSEETLSRLQFDLMVDGVFASNAIEGNPLSRGETLAILRAGHVIGARRREATEALNLGLAIEFVQKNLISADAPYSSANLLGVHGLILKCVNDDWAGRFRSAADSQLMLTGAKHQPPDASAVPELVDRIMSRLQAIKNVHPVVMATWAHWALARVHPFMDGNGRIARLWQDLVLFRARLTSAVIPPHHRQEYYKALESADEGGFDPLIQLVGQQVLTTFDRYFEAQKDADSLREWASQVVLESIDRTDESRLREYLQWKRRMEQVRYAFQRAAAAITNASDKITVQYRPFDMIDQPKWERLRSSEAITDALFFTLDVNGRRRQVRYSFLFGKRNWVDSRKPDADFGDADRRVSLLANEGDMGKGMRLVGSAACADLNFRELFVFESKIVRRSVNPRGHEISDTDVDPLTVAQDFIQDVILKRLT